jgi:hypothetical protein
MSARYEVGLALLLTDRTDERPGGLCRDDLLFSVVDAVAGKLLLDDYELREVLSADLPMSCGSDDDRGDLVVMCRSDNVGGPLPEARAAPLRARLEELGPRGTLSDVIAAVVPMTKGLLLPPPCLTSRFAFNMPAHALNGLEHVNIVDVLKLLAPLREAGVPEAARFGALLDFCRAERFPVSVTKD